MSRCFSVVTQLSDVILCIDLLRSWEPHTDGRMEAAFRLWVQTEYPARCQNCQEGEEEIKVKKYVNVKNSERE